MKQLSFSGETVHFSNLVVIALTILKFKILVPQALIT
jgi:hypothetical protein